MIKRLYYLNGLAILAVVINHAAAWGQIAMFLWPHRYLPVTSPNWDQLGTLPYYLLLITRQLCVFAVPAFLFTSGYFISYAARGSQNTLTRRMIFSKIFYLVIPYAIWSVIVFLMDFVYGKTYTFIEILNKLLTGQALGPYFFVPVLCWLYFLSPLIVYAVRTNWKLALIVSVFIQFISVSFRYLSYYGVDLPGLGFLLRITPIWLPFLYGTFFVIGIIIGLQLGTFKEWLARSKGIFIILLPITTVLNIIEGDFVLQITQKNWGAYQETVTFHLYAINFIFVFLILAKLPYTKKITFLSNKTYGIYLVHMIVMEFLARLIYHFLPKILAYRIVFVPLLFIFGLFVPLVFMTILEKSAMRKYTRYIFG